mmetsp:Transcript_19911/g.35013  ORF Transcript_19911/g.35013 Transcript_19911/m.35013 type:complete len:111 (-) Transcript_19911:2007-2339(-)
MSTPKWVRNFVNMFAFSHHENVVHPSAALVKLRLKPKAKFLPFCLHLSPSALQSSSKVTAKANSSPYVFSFGGRVKVQIRILSAGCRLGDRSKSCQVEAYDVPGFCQSLP